MTRAFNGVIFGVIATLCALGAVIALAFAGLRLSVGQAPRALYVLGPPSAAATLAYFVFGGWLAALISFVGVYLVWRGKLSLSEEGVRREAKERITIAA